MDSIKLNLLYQTDLNNNNIKYQNIYYIINNKKFDYLDKYIDLSKQINKFDILINIIISNILDIYNNISDYILFLDYLKNNNILTSFEHMISYIIPKLEQRFDIILILDTYVTNINNLIYYMNINDLNNIDIILEYMNIKDIKLNKFNEDFDDFIFLDYLFKKDIYNNVLIKYLCINPLINQTDDKIKTINELGFDYKYYMRYFIKYLYDKLDDHNKQLINETYQILFNNDRITSDYLVNEYIYHVSINEHVKKYIKSRLDRYTNNTKYITYYLTYLYTKDDPNVWLIDKYMNKGFNYIINYLCDNNIYNNDLFNYIDDHIDKIDLTLLDENTNKLIFDILHYYYKFNKNKINKIIKHVKIRLNNNKFFNLIMDNNILLDELYDDMIYNHIMDIKNYNINIIKYVIKNYDNKDEKIKEIIMKIFDKIDRNYIITELEHKLIIKYNKFDNYIQLYKKRCDIIENKLNLGKDVIDIIYSYSYL